MNPSKTPCQDLNQRHEEHLRKEDGMEADNEDHHFDTEYKLFGSVRQDVVNIADLVDCAQNGTTKGKRSRHHRWAHVS